MAREISVSVVDRYKLGQRLSKSPQVVYNKLNKALLNIAIDMQREASQQVPVITARLQSSIQINRGNLRYTIAPHTEYAEWVHEGSKGEHIPEKLRNSSYTGNPFMDRAFKTVEPRARRDANDAIQDIIKSI